MEIKGLWALLAIECVLLVAFLALAIALMWVPSISACRNFKVCVGVGWGVRVWVCV
jgi:hypothetical protein